MKDRSEAPPNHSESLTETRSFWRRRAHHRMAARSKQFGPPAAQAHRPRARLVSSRTVGTDRLFVLIQLIGHAFDIAAALNAAASAPITTPTTTIATWSRLYSGPLFRQIGTIPSSPLKHRCIAHQHFATGRHNSARKSQARLKQQTRFHVLVPTKRCRSTGDEVGVMASAEWSCTAMALER